MPITYTWDFGPLETKTENNLTDVVKIVHWRLTGINGDYSSTVYGTVSLDSPTSNSFTTFSSLTKTKVKGWVINKLDKTEAELKAQISLQINHQKNPVQVNKKAPWEV